MVIIVKSYGKIKFYVIGVKIIVCMLSNKKGTSACRGTVNIASVFVFDIGSGE